MFEGMRKPPPKPGEPKAAREPATGELMYMPKTYMTPLERVKIGVHNLCTIILTHFPNMPLGDSSWVEGYKAYLAREKKGS